MATYEVTMHGPGDPQGLPKTYTFKGVCEIEIDNGFVWLLAQNRDIEAMYPAEKVYSIIKMED